MSDVRFVYGIKSKSGLYLARVRDQPNAQARTEGNEFYVTASVSRAAWWDTEEEAAEVIKRLHVVALLWKFEIVPEPVFEEFR